MCIICVRKGKKQRILINKKDHNKVVGYREFVLDSIMVAILIVLLTVVFT
jgi:hypothetical protein